MAKEFTTLMYEKQTYKGEERIVVHKFPWNARDPLHLLKMQKFLDRGFTFTDPRNKNSGIQVIVNESPSAKPPDIGDVPDSTEIKGEEGMEICGVCRKPCKGKFGLMAHMKSHNAKVS